MIGDDDLDAAVAAGLLSPDLRAKLVAFAASRRETETAGAMTAPQAKFDPVHVLYCAFNFVFIALGLFFDRRVYAVFGAIGLTIYLGHLAFDVFKDVLAFSFALSAIGFAINFAGVFVERRRHAFGMLIDAYLPEVLRALRPPRARHA
jgi:hypothetical protein